MKILVLCTGNSCRSQMAHGWLEHFSNDIEVYSAGTKPAEKVNPFAVQAMDRFDIDISSHLTNNVEDYRSFDFDLVLTVCDNAKESCPVVFDDVETIHESFTDPVNYDGDDDEKLEFYIQVSTGIRDWIKILLTEKGLIKDN